MAHSVSDITGIDPRIQQRLEELDVSTVEQFVQRTRTPAQTAELAKAVGIPLTQLTELVNRGNLLCLDGLDVTMANLLARAGVDSIQQLCRESTQPLHARLVSANAQWRIAPAVPSVAQIQRWIDQAQKLNEQELAESGLTDQEVTTQQP